MRIEGLQKQDYTDTEAVRIAEGGPGVLYVRRAGGNNRAFHHACAVLARQAGLLEESSEDLEHQVSRAVIIERVQVEAAGRYLVAGWESVTDADTGEFVKFSPDAAVELLQTYPAIYELVMAAAGDDERFRRDADCKSD